MLSPGEQLKHWRTERHKTQQEVADFLDISRFGVSKRERGKAKISLEERQKLIEFLDIPKYKQKDFL